MNKNKLTGLAGAVALGAGLALSSPAGAQQLSENDMFNARMYAGNIASYLDGCQRQLNTPNLAEYDLSTVNAALPQIGIISGVANQIRTNNQPLEVIFQEFPQTFDIDAVNTFFDSITYRGEVDIESCPRAANSINQLYDIIKKSNSN